MKRSSAPWLPRSEPLSTHTVVIPSALAGLRLRGHVLDQQRARRIDAEPLAQQAHSRAGRAWAASSLAWMSWSSSKCAATPIASSTRRA